MGLEYDPDRHGHYLPGPKLEISYTDLIQLPGRFWVENIAGRTAMICWSASKFQPKNMTGYYWFFAHQMIDHQVQTFNQMVIN